MSSYAYNIAVDSRLQKAKRLTTIVPSNGNPKEYNKKITSAFVQVFFKKIFSGFKKIIRNWDYININ